MAKRGGFPGGMPGNMNNLMKQAQKMQRQMEEAQKELEEKEVTAAAGGGAGTAAGTAVGLLPPRRGCAPPRAGGELFRHRIGKITPGAGASGGNYQGVIVCTTN